MAKLGPVMDEKLLFAVTYANERERADLLMLSFTGVRHLQRARVLTARFLDKGSSDFAEKARAEFTAATEAWSAMSAKLPDEPRAALAALTEAQGTYTKGLGDLEALVKARQLLEETLATRWVEIRTGAEKLDELYRTEQVAMVAEAKESSRTTLWSALAISASALFLGMLLSGLVAGAILRQIHGICEAVKLISAGDLTVEAPVETEDELGKMTEQLNDMAKLLRTSMHEIAAGSSQLAAASEELSTVSQSMSAAAEQTSVQAVNVAVAVSEVDENIQRVASATEMVSSTIHQVAHGATEAAQISSGATNAAEQTRLIMKQLEASSEQVGQVVQLISRIADQTNLLALNATIEAARAGEAGAGFAVVANEVKELANETARSTASIDTQIQAIQKNTRSATKAIEEMAKVIIHVDEISNTIAGAVQEQTASTQEISKGAADAAEGSATISKNIEGMSEAAGVTAANARHVSTASDDLAGMANKMTTLVNRFRC